MVHSSGSDSGSDSGSGSGTVSWGKRLLSSLSRDVPRAARVRAEFRAAGPRVASEGRGSLRMKRWNATEVRRSTPQRSTPSPSACAICSNALPPFLRAFPARSKVVTPRGGGEARAAPMRSPHACTHAHTHLDERSEEWTRWPKCRAHEGADPRGTGSWSTCRRCWARSLGRRSARLGTSTARWSGPGWCGISCIGAGGRSPGRTSCCSSGGAPPPAGARSRTRSPWGSLCQEPPPPRTPASDQAAGQVPRAAGPCAA